MVLPFASLALFCTAANAKTVRLEPVSRAVLRDECQRAGGKPIGIGDENSAYGCAAQYVGVSCTPDADCEAVVRDTMPVVGNSLRAILSLGRQPANGARAIQPVDARVNSATTP
jgi:hypothetical protein